MEKFEAFCSLHQQEGPFILPNSWDVKSAQIIERSGYKATATSSAAVANCLGYEDGENMSFDEYLFVIKRIVSSVGIPVSIDLETGFGKTPEVIAGNIITLHGLGVAGINIEDSVIRNSQRSLADAAEFSEKLRDVKTILDSEGVTMFINVRCDSFLLDVKDKLNETVQRAGLYEKTGVDGLFVPLLTDADHIRQITKSTSLPLNVLTVKGLPDFDTLNRAGVKRISLGDFLFQKVYRQIPTVLNMMEREKGCGVLFEDRVMNPIN